MVLLAINLDALFMIPKRAHVDFSAIYRLRRKPSMRWFLPISRRGSTSPTGYSLNTPYTMQIDFEGIFDMTWPVIFPPIASKQTVARSLLANSPS
jgi:hypothetical protein